MFTVVLISIISRSQPNLTLGFYKVVIYGICICVFIRNDEVLQFVIPWMELAWYYIKWKKSDENEQLLEDLTYLWYIQSKEMNHIKWGQILDL